MSAFIRHLDDVRLRPLLVEALGAIGDARAMKPLLAEFERERYLHIRPLEANALLELGARGELEPGLARFAGVPEPMPGVLEAARRAGFLRPARAGWTASAARAGQDDATLNLTLALPGPPGRARLFVGSARRGGEDAAPPGPPSVEVEGEPASLVPDGHGGWTAELARELPTRVSLVLRDARDVEAVWLVRRREELPPPAPRAWDAGAEDAGEDGAGP